MNKLNVVLSAAIAAAFVAGCASDGRSSKMAGGVQFEPVQRITGANGPDAWYTRGRYFQGQNRWDEAESSFRKVLEMQPSHAEAHNALGAVLAGRGQLAAAESEFRAGVKAAPDQAHIRSNLGRVLMLQGRHDEAKVALEDAALIDPDNRTARANLAELRTLGGQGGQEVAVSALAARGAGVTPITASAEKATRPELIAANRATEGAKVTAIAPASTNGVVVVTAVPLGDSRSPIRKLEPTVASAAAVTTLSYQEIKGVAPLAAVSPLPAGPEVKATKSAVLEPSAATVEVVQAQPPTSVAVTSEQASLPVTTVEALPPPVVAAAPVEVASPPVVATAPVEALPPQIVAAAPVEALPPPVVVAAPVEAPPPQIVAAAPVEALPPSVVVAAPVEVPPPPVVVAAPVEALPPPVAAVAPVEASPPLAVAMATVEVPLPVAAATEEPSSELVPMLAEAEQVSVSSPQVAATSSAAFVVMEHASPAAAADAARSAPVRLEVSNGNGVEGMARRIRKTLVADGYSPVRVTNKQPYRQKLTAIQYRVGFEPQARALGGRFPHSAGVVYQARLDARADVRILLGRDLPRSFALNEEKGATVLLASADKEVR